MKNSFANAKVEKVIRNAGAQRVSADAIKLLNQNLGDYATNIAKQAIAVARHNNRKTVKAGDIKLVMQ